jgi:uncharacterized membrane protein YgdD (TMEM256/DUF423 family)
MHKWSLLAGTFFGSTSIMLGAFGAHYLKKIFTPELLVSFETGVRYQFYHAIALLLLGMYAKLANQSVQWISTLFCLGTVLFSGSIYLLCILKSNNQIGLKGLGILTPIGGVLFIVAWICWMLKIMNWSGR